VRQALVMVREQQGGSGRGCRGMQIEFLNGSFQVLGGRKEPEGGGGHLQLGAGLL
jgi:hypothetical protein